MKKSKYLLAITVIAASMSGMVYAKSNNDWQHESQTRKADYIYLEALRQSLRSVGMLPTSLYSAHISSTRPTIMSDGRRVCQ